MRETTEVATKRLLDSGKIQQGILLIKEAWNTWSVRHQNKSAVFAECVFEDLMRGIEDQVHE